MNDRKDRADETNHSTTIDVTIVKKKCESFIIDIFSKI